MATEMAAGAFPVHHQIKIARDALMESEKAWLDETIQDRDLADPLLRHRLTWRSAHVVICSRKLHCNTFDELPADLEVWLGTLQPR